MLVGVNIGLMNLSGSTKRGYHHGDLRNALGEAAVQLAREGGPDSVTVRAAARLVGVTPTAAYRHYTGHEELVAEAKQQCLSRLGEFITEELLALPPARDRVLATLRNLVAAGRAYVKFALTEPGQFRTCFFQGGAVLDRDPQEHMAFGMLVGLLDELVAAGFLKPERRPMAEVATWSAVHGLALLMLDGPLRDVADEVKQEASRRTMLIMLSGLGELTPELESALT
jgi:AcrR family transcriptional regulator